MGEVPGVGAGARQMVMMKEHDVSEKEILKEFFAERRTRNAEAVRKVFKAEASKAKDPRIMTAFATLATVGDVEMLDRVMRSLRV